MMFQKSFLFFLHNVLPVFVYALLHWQLLSGRTGNQDAAVVFFLSLFLPVILVVHL